MQRRNAQRLIRQAKVRGVRIVTYAFSLPRHNLAQQQQVPWEHATLERQLRFKEAGQRADTLFNMLVDQKRVECTVLVQARRPSQLAPGRLGRRSDA